MQQSSHDLFLRAIVMLCLIILAININGFLHKRHLNFLGESAVTIMLGAVAGAIWTAIRTEEQSTTIQLSSEFFTMFLLPPIIFEGGFTLQRIVFFQNGLTIVSLAFFGGLYSTFMTAIIVHYLSLYIFPLTFIESMLLGCLVSSTDPVTVLSLLPSNVDKRLYMLIFGESALNDALSIILYKLFSNLGGPEAQVNHTSILSAIGSVILVSLESLLIGVVAGLLFAKITKHVHMPDAEIYQVLMLFVFAYTSYLLADVLHLAGIISVFFCGITMAHYSYDNLEKEALPSLKVIMRLLSTMCETFIFLYLGLALFSYGPKTVFDPLMILVTFLTLFVSRTHVFLILGIGNFLFRNSAPGSKIPFKHHVLIWFSGLRGALAFALAVVFLDQPGFSDQVKSVVFGTTIIVVILTILFMGGLTPLMLKWLKINEETPEVELPTAQAVGSANKRVSFVETAAAGVTSTAGWFYKLDCQYILPFFTRRVKPERRPSVDWSKRKSNNPMSEDSNEGSIVAISTKSSRASLP